MSRSYKNTVIAILLACILTMSIGYAVLQQRLDISGTSKITSEFNIQIVDINEILVQQLAETADISFTPTSATYSANLQAPGDEAVYEIVIENKGNIPGYVILRDFGNYDMYDDGNISIGVVFTSKSQYTGDFENLQSTERGVNYLNPGEKLYVYTDIFFSSSATSLPDKKTFSNTINFDFTQTIPDTTSNKELLVTQYTERYNYSRLLKWNVTNAKIIDDTLNSTFTLSFDIERPTDDTEVYDWGCGLDFSLQTIDGDVIYVDDLNSYENDGYYYQFINTKEIEVFMDTSLSKSTLTFTGPNYQYGSLDDVYQLKYNFSCVE